MTTQNSPTKWYLDFETHWKGGRTFRIRLTGSYLATNRGF